MCESKELPVFVVSVVREKQFIAVAATAAAGNLIIKCHFLKKTGFKTFPSTVNPAQCAQTGTHP